MTNKIEVFRPVWEEDNQANSCYNCGTKFTFTKRRHHCRLCGNIFCNTCSSYRITASHLGYHNAVRCCKECYQLEKEGIEAKSNLKEAMQTNFHQTLKALGIENEELQISDYNLLFEKLANTKEPLDQEISAKAISYLSFDEQNHWILVKNVYLTQINFVLQNSENKKIFDKIKLTVLNLSMNKQFQPRLVRAVGFQPFIDLLSEDTEKFKLLALTSLADFLRLNEYIAEKLLSSDCVSALVNADFPFGANQYLDRALSIFLYSVSDFKRGLEELDTHNAAGLIITLLVNSELMDIKLNAAHVLHLLADHPRSRKLIIKKDGMNVMKNNAINTESGKLVRLSCRILAKISIEIPESFIQNQGISALISLLRSKHQSDKALAELIIPQLFTELENSPMWLKPKGLKWLVRLIKSDFPLIQKHAALIMVSQAASNENKIHLVCAGVLIPLTELAMSDNEQVRLAAKCARGMLLL
ncbi:early endosome antigen [Anaeramoeba flamelloides]|uniref:Early endosome antigen n=1 Tax=Anaeramoeba flamelloides TaxID=1746091 RepID=A0AAV7ZHG9_9EUKA|nr:early endosome antigen [Anaeramoeba flamelloides]|eukprot:Anaeramoba_flamelloidesa1059715_39.p1 GENE.a1059715_39~~a1059715_39.p1  ORF type:complete len:472 (+),score=94.43 a1059715_39:87-1502(+)